MGNTRYRGRTIAASRPKWSIRPLSRALGQRSTADRLRERAAAMRGDLALSLAREMDFLFRF
jgi:hypothetical protein